MADPFLVPYTNGAGTAILDLTYAKDRMGSQSYWVYDSLRRLIQAKDARGNSTTYGYCTCGGLTAVTNALSQATHYTLDHVRAGHRHQLPRWHQSQPRLRFPEPPGQGVGGPGQPDQYLR